MRALDAELSQTKEFREPPPLSQQPRGIMDFLMLQLSRVDWRKALIALGVLVFVGGAAGVWLVWHNHKSADPLAGLKPGIYQPNQKSSGESLPIPPPPKQH